MITPKILPRRAFLRGLGVSLALPFLDAMVPAFARPNRTDAAPVNRLAFVYVPNGVIMEHWRPETLGADYELTQTLEPLGALRDETLLFSGLAQHNGRALGDGPGDHARAAATFLTGVHPKKTDGADIHVGISIDQVAAQAIGGRTRFASLELGTEPGRLAGNCDSGYSCAYSNSISWRSETTPNPPEIDPRLVFERLFGDGDGSETPEQRALRLTQDRSILDFVQGDAKRLQGDLGASDRRKLDEYLDGVRDIERRIVSAETTDEPRPEMEKPSGIPVRFAEHLDVMFDLMRVAMQTDSTRVLSFMIGREGSNRTYPEVGVPDAHHGISHHKGNEEKIAKLAKINHFHMTRFAAFLERLASTPDGDGSLLDHSMIVYGSGLSDGNRHHHHDLPLLLAGRGAGSVHPGRHIEYTNETPLNNLYVSLLDRVGVPAETLGDSTGKIAELSDI